MKRYYTQKQVAHLKSFFEAFIQFSLIKTSHTFTSVKSGFKHSQIKLYVKG